MVEGFGAAIDDSSEGGREFGLLQDIAWQRCLAVVEIGLGRCWPLAETVAHETHDIVVVDGDGVAVLGVFDGGFKDGCAVERAEAFEGHQPATQRPGDEWREDASALAFVIGIAIG